MQCVVCMGACARRRIFQIFSDFRIRNGGTCSEVVEVLMHKFKCSMLQCPCHAQVLKDLVLQAAEYSRQLVYIAEPSRQHNGGLIPLQLTVVDGCFCLCRIRENAATGRETLQCLY